MKPPFNKKFKEIAQSMGISLWQRFSVNEASLFLRCQESDVIALQQAGKINFIQVTSNQIMFFGYQLLEYLLAQTSNHTVSSSTAQVPDRIIRSSEVLQMTGLSRTTLWRMETNGKFPRRVALGGNSVGWRLNEVQEWIHQR